MADGAGDIKDVAVVVYHLDKPAASSLPNSRTHPVALANALEEKFA